MPAPCTVCGHPRRADIDAELLANVTVRGLQNALAKRYELTPMALSRHRRAGHVPGLSGLVAKAGPLPTTPGGWQLVLADPPWRFEPRSRATGLALSADAHYPTMSLDDICALRVRQIAARDSVLLLWTTGPMLVEGHADRVIRAWGFTPATMGFVWTKTTARGAPVMGQGYYTRSGAEYCLLATRGKGLQVVAHDVYQVIMEPPREHSRKPDGLYARVERLFGPAISRAELFARTAWPGWTPWGLEVGKFPAPLLLPLTLAEAAG
jgi:N6-adenosine-specific RNA methylase IME4